MDDNKIIVSKEYKELLKSIKEQIKTARNKAIRKVNSGLIELYYSIGQQIVEKQEKSSWGDDLIGQIEKDIKRELPDITGFSRTNLFYMKKLLSLKLYKRQGKALTNFDKTINCESIELLKDSFKESYILDFLQLSEQAKEKELEKSLVQNITRFLMEMGKGFAFVGKQYKLTVGDKEFFIDLLFYNYILKRFVIVELKTTEFKPEHIGQIGFYITAIDRDIKTDSDKPTIGLIICKTKNDTIVEYALSNSNQPTGVAEYKLRSELPEDIANYLPNAEDMQKVLETNSEESK
ncbi:MAG: hypothetical protein B6I17_04215 [Tenericutes bacterium 4572_104]|nr:MAG: hypothetical protein B6I17_04215 [Tenericutes bacterium 4572_104]